jgi:type I restriction enzyme R subunit
MSFEANEKYQSQIPALQLLVNLGFTPLSQAEARAKRGGRLRNVLLEEVLGEQLLKLNRYTHRGTAHHFDVGDAHEAIRRLKPTPDRPQGIRGTNQAIYDSLVLGTTIAKTLADGSKSYSFKYIDWERPENNVFHVTAELSVERTASTQTNRCDIVCYVNGIPFVVIENKSPTAELKKADSQLIGYQHEDAIPQLFHFAQLLLTMKRNEARYATVGTSRKYWQTWRDEEDSDETIAAIANRRLTEPQKTVLFTGDFAAAQSYFEEATAGGERSVTDQDRTIYALCRPERLLDLVRRFTVFDNGIRKVARHQQYFGVLEAMRTVTQRSENGQRDGGVIWHTQGSGKSLTMVMLGRALALDASIQNPRILIVTDRDDLDKQIKDTFLSCDLEPVRATSGAALIELIRDKAPLVTSIINKFETASRATDAIDLDSNIFVLVDESHRSQSGRFGGSGTFAGRMRRMLPNACYLGFTGTPLLKGEKSTVAQFGGLIHRYTIDQAVADGAVVPLLYEGRMVEQQVTGDAINLWLDKLCEGLTPEQKADLKRKFSRMDALSKSEQAIRAKAFDISEHYRQNWQGTGFKAQLVAPNKAAAVRFKQVLDEIGHVSSEIIISAPEENEGNEQVDAKSTQVVREFWDVMMKRFGTESAYTSQLIEAFKGTGGPEILIVVSKLLTGFDAPRDTVLYLCKPLKEHTLLQAIARVNRLFEDGDVEKQFGFIVDYEGLLGELDEALTAYTALDGFEPDDLVGAVHDVREQIRRLPQLRDQLWGLFKTVKNRTDMEQFEQFLEDDAIRHEFYERLCAYSRCLHISLSSDKFFAEFDAAAIDAMKADWKRFAALKRSAQLRYQEIIDLKDFEPKIQKLLDDHVVALPAEIVIELVNINDPDALRAVVSDTDVSPASKADRITSATRRAINERIDEDPALYRRFSEMLEETIRAYREHRMGERYLLEAIALAENVAHKERGREVPEAIAGNADAQAIFGVLDSILGTPAGEQAGVDPFPLDPRALAEMSNDLTGLISERHIVGMWGNEVAQNALMNALDDYFIDVLRDTRELELPFEIIDRLQDEVMAVARARFSG